MKITPDFSSEPMQARREGNELFSVKGKRKGMGSRRDEKLMFCFQTGGIRVSAYW